MYLAFLHVYFYALVLDSETCLSLSHGKKVRNHENRGNQRIHMLTKNISAILNSKIGSSFSPVGQAITRSSLERSV